jgi:hypothetical protein
LQNIIEKLNVFTTSCPIGTEGVLRGRRPARLRKFGDAGAAFSFLGFFISVFLLMS